MSAGALGERGIDGVTPVMPQPLGNEGDEVLRLAQFLKDELHHLEDCADLSPLISVLK